MSSIDKSKKSNLEQKMNKESEYGITDPKILEIFKGLSKIEKNAISKLSPKERERYFKMLLNEPITTSSSGLTDDSFELGIDDPNLRKFYKSLKKEEQEKIIDLPTIERRIMFLQFIKNAREEVIKKNKKDKSTESVDEWGKEIFKVGEETQSYVPPEELKQIQKDIVTQPILETVFGKDVDEGEEEDEEEAKQKGKKLSPPQINFEKMVDTFYITNPFNYAMNQTA